jgi:hypothetical protein
MEETLDSMFYVELIKTNCISASCHKGKRIYRGIGLALGVKNFDSSERKG